MYIYIMRKTLSEKKITEQSLLKSAMKLFLRDGFSNVSIAQIAADSNLTRGAFYWHFTSKDDILLKILELNRSKILKDNKIQFESDHSDMWEFTHHLLLSRIDNFWKSKDFREYVELTWFKLEQQFSGKSIQYKTSINDYFITELAEVLKQGQINGTIRKTYTPLQMATNAAALLNGIYRLYFVSSHLKDKKLASNMIDLFCDSLRP